MRTTKTLAGDQKKESPSQKQREQWKLLRQQYNLHDPRAIKERIFFDNLMGLIILLMDPTFENKVRVNKFRHEWGIAEDADNRFSEYLRKKAGLS